MSLTTVGTSQTPRSGGGPSGDPGGPKRVSGGLLDPAQLLKSTPDALRKLDRGAAAQPGHVRGRGRLGADHRLGDRQPSVFSWAITIWLWLTCVFANLAEAVAEGRGKGSGGDSAAHQARDDGPQAQRLAPRSTGRGQHRGAVSGSALTIGDHVVVQAGEIIPGDGDVVEGIASVDESAITGESAPVIRSPVGTAAR